MTWRKIMPLTKLNFLPGLDTENTETGAEGRWVDGDKIKLGLTLGYHKK